MAKQLKSITPQLLPPSLYPTDSATVWVRSNAGVGPLECILRYRLFLLLLLNKFLSYPILTALCCLLPHFFNHDTLKMNHKALWVLYILIDYLVIDLF